MAAQQPHANTNQLLAGLKPAELAVLQPYFERVDLRLGERLSVAGKAIRYAYFPVSGMISIIHTYKDGSTMEVGLIGREGFWGTSLVLDVRSSPFEAMVQGDGQALRIATKDLLSVVDAHPELRSQLLRYAHFLQVQVSITAACNGSHKVPTRLARWLLEAHDRMGDRDIQLSHELLSYMLGVRRAGVTDALSLLSAKGFVVPGRGRISIRNRKGVEGAACECYRITKAEYRHIFSTPKLRRT
jgi:CRP-like cAMP-binding protein